MVLTNVCRINTLNPKLKLQCLLPARSKLVLTNVCLINTPNPKPLTKAAMCVANQALEHKGPLDKLLAPLTHYNTQVWRLGFRV